MQWPEGLSPYPLLLLAVVLAARFLPLPQAYHPLTLFRYFAQKLADKVHPDTQRPAQQQYISGSLAVLVALLPFLALFYALYQFSELPLVLDALLLYGSLDWSWQKQQALKITALLQRQQLSLARDEARQLLCRDTNRLSALGISKALIESLLLRSSQHVIGTLLWFIVGGGLAALGYRLLLITHQQWNVKKRQYQYFGKPAAALAAASTALPMLISIALLALQYGLSRCIKQIKAHTRRYFNSMGLWLLCSASAALQVNVAGPAFYDGNKHQRLRIGQYREPDWPDIKRCVKLLYSLHLYFLALLASYSLLQLVWMVAR